MLQFYNGIFCFFLEKVINILLKNGIFVKKYIYFYTRKLKSEK